MSTVTAMARSSYMMYDVSTRYPTFGGSTGSSYGSSSSLPSISTNDDALQSIIEKQLAEQKDTIAKLEDYQKTSDKFYSGYFPNMDSLQDSSKALKETDFKSKDTEAIVANIEQFTKDYNATVNFLKDNASISTRIKSLSNSFSSTKNNRRTLETIGVNVDNTGKLSIDKEKLTAALAEDPDSVKSMLGNRGLSKQTYDKTTAAVKNASNLVPFPKLSNRATNFLTQGTLLDFLV